MRHVVALATLATFVLSSMACSSTTSSATDAPDASGKTRKEHAAEHRSAAPELQAFEDDACRAVEHDARAECPLLGAVIAANDLEDGIILRLSMHAHTRAVIDRVRCHIAFGHVHSQHEMDKCPLYIEGVKLRPAEEGRSIELTVDNPSMLPELWRRVHDHSGW